MNILFTIPAYNEGKILRANILTLQRFFDTNFPDTPWKIVVVDNASTDNTKSEVEFLNMYDQRILYFFVKEKGKGAALRTVWQYYDADVYCFMDADLSTDIAVVPTMIRLIEKTSDVVVTSRRKHGARVKRSLLRRCISFFNNLLIRFFLKTHASDTPCGCKAFRRKVIENVMPLVKNNSWFFDTELLVRAERLGYRVTELPVHWSDTADKKRKSSVSTFNVSKEYLANILRLRKELKQEKHP